MRLLTCFAVLLTAVACGTGDNQPEANTSTTTHETTTTSGSTATTDFPPDVSLPDSFPDGLLEKIVVEAANKAGVSMSDIEVTSVKAMTFNDAALGCPEPGKMYAQVLTPGFIVLLDADGVEADYRVVQSSGEFRICN
jgi:hypothetical protein